LRTRRTRRRSARADFLETLEKRWLFVAPGTPANPFPVTNIVTNPVPSTFTWTATSNTTSYDVYLNGVLQQTVTTPSWAHGPIATTGAQNWQVIAKNSADGTQTPGPTWNFTQFRVPGIDVSVFQGSMNFTTAFNKGVRFAFVRASRGDTVPDPNVAVNVPNAKNAGLLVGVYHRILPFSNTNDDGAFVDPIVEADKLISSGGAYMGNGYMRPVVDVENGESLASTPVNGYNLSSWVVAFINRVKSVKGVDPLVYTGSAFAQSYLNSTVVTASPDLWIANWTADTDPLTTNVGPHYPTSGTIEGTAPWRTNGQTWDFWQYSSTGVGSQYGAASTNIDLDVFRGTDADHANDYNLLKQNFVTGAADIPINPSPANNASNVSSSNVLLNWNDSPGAIAYDVYLDNQATPIATNINVSQYNVSSVAGGAHKWRVVAKGVLADDDTHVSSPIWSFTATNLPLPGVPSGPNPNNVFVTTKPLVLDWADTPNAATYDVYLGASGTPTYTDLTSSETPQINPVDGVRMWRVVAKNAVGSTNGPQWQYTMDATPPAAAYGAQTPTNGAAFLDFTVTYTDATSGVDFTSLDSSDVTVMLPDNTSLSATLISLDANANGATRIATYRIAAPGGTWDSADNGTYTVKQVASQVRDVAGGYRAAGQIGTFNVNLTQPFAYKVGSVLHVDFDGTAMPIALSQAAGTFAATRNGTTLNFTGVTGVEIAGTPSADDLRIGSGIPVPTTFANQAGGDSITITAGTYTFDTDFNPALRNIDLTIDGGAAAVFAGTMHFDALTINGHASMTANGANVLVAKSVTMAEDAWLDLSDNDMVIDYDGPSPIGAFDGAIYSHVTGRIQAAYDFSAWDGPGIRTSQPAAAAGLTTLGIGEAADAFGLGATDTSMFGSETVDGTALLIKYTYAGDANLDGVIDGGDYGLIDNFVQVPSASGYFNGDFNYDGVIDGGDYGVIDNNIQAQGPQL